jgi:TonB family protein
MPALAKSGEVSKFAKQVVAALAKAKPNAPGVKGSVTVTVVVAFGGGVRTAKVTGSSGREDLDKLALEAAKKAKLPPPPQDVTTDDLFYDVEYKFE